MIMDDDLQLEAWLRVAAADIAPKKLRQLAEAFEFDARRLLDAGRKAWGDACPDLMLKQAGRLEDSAKIDVTEGMATARRLQANVITFADPAYPANLRPLADAPAVLFVRGELVADDRYAIAIVGSRRASTYGLAISDRFSRELAARGLTIVSGGARGIDTRAHAGALNAGGRTVAFIGSGLDISYPAENRKLFERIATSGQGAVVSEYGFGSTPEPWRFPARNRLISGMTMGTLVIESPIDSGAILTANNAAAQGRDVFAVPGPIETGRNTGSHKLIQEGAKLVQSPQDILDELGLLTLTSTDGSVASASLPPAPSNLDPEQRRILDMLNLQARSVDSLIVESTYAAPMVVGILTMLELKGLARRVPGNSFVRVL
jgi:DNA processing protein